MKTNYSKLILCTLTILFASSLAQTQTWYTIGSGASSDTSGEYTLTSSVGGIAYADTSDSAYSLASGYFQGLEALSNENTVVTFQPEADWNLLSLHAAFREMKKDSVFQTAVSPAYEFNEGYRIKDTLEIGKGFWIKFDTASLLSLPGFMTEEETIAVNDRWNIIGSITTGIASGTITALGTSVVSDYYSFSSGTGYLAEDSIRPGKGYWVKVNGSGRLVMKAGSFLENTSISSAAMKKTTTTRSISSLLKEQENIYRLSITDVTGSERMIYFSGSQTKIDPKTTELPPPPPSGLDVRFTSGRQYESPDENEAVHTSVIRISNAQYPVTVRWDDVQDESNYQLKLTTPETSSKDIPLKEQGMVILENVDQQLNLIIGSGVPELPKEFAVQQNYPNPFNPSTVLRYQLPVNSYVTLKVYDVLGREVATLVDGLEDAGYKTLDWNASDLPSGIYFYRVTAQSSDGVVLTDIKKMLLLR